MARDYKHAARTRIGDRPRGSRNTPGWVWLVTGIVIGGLIAGGVYFYHEKDTPTETAAPATAPMQPKTASGPSGGKPVADTSKQQDKPRFDFYTLLPEMEVVIPDSEAKRDQPTANSKNVYLLQAGSFRNHSDADALKAQLALLGVEANIETINTGTEEWYRVRVGPFREVRELNSIRERLQQNRINTLLIKIAQP